MYSTEYKQFKENQKFYHIQASKIYDFKLEDFDIIGGSWKHKDWNTWMKGANGYAETKKIVKQYIDECKKPYGERDLSFIHLVND